MGDTAYFSISRYLSMATVDVVKTWIYKGIHYRKMNKIERLISGI